MWFILFLRFCCEINSSDSLFLICVPISDVVFNRLGNFYTVFPVGFTINICAQCWTQTWLLCVCFITCTLLVSLKAKLILRTCCDWLFCVAIYRCCTPHVSMRVHHHKDVCMPMHPMNHQMYVSHKAIHAPTWHRNSYMGVYTLMCYMYMYIWDRLLHACKWFICMQIHNMHSWTCISWFHAYIHMHHTYAYTHVSLDKHHCTNMHVSHASTCIISVHITHYIRTCTCVACMHMFCVSACTCNK